MAQSVDIQEVIAKSTSEVSLQDLSRKGFKQVKVLNQATISKLIAEAVDTVLDSRTAEISESERERVIEESRTKFEVLARERVEEHSQVEKLSRERAELEEEIEVLRGRLDAALEIQVQRDQVILERDRIAGELRLTRERSISIEVELGKERARGANPELLERARQEAKGLEERVAAAATRIEELEAQVAELELIRSERDEGRHRLEELEARAAEVDALRADLEEARRRLEAATGETERCASLEASLAESRAQIERAHEELEDTRAKHASCEARCADLERRALELEERSQRVNALEDELRASRESHAVSQREVAVSEGRLIAKEEEIERIRRASEELVERVSRSLGGRIGASGGKGASSDVVAMLAGIQENMKRLSRGGSSSTLDDGDVEALLRFAEGGSDDSSAESNFTKVEVEQRKSGGVKGSLAKLRALQEGAKGQDDGTES